MRLSLYRCLSLFILLLTLPSVCCCKYEYWFFLPRPARTAPHTLSLSHCHSLFVAFSSPSLSRLVIEYNFALCRILLLLIALRSVAFFPFCLVSCTGQYVAPSVVVMFCSFCSTLRCSLPALPPRSSLPLPLSVQKGATAAETAFVLSTSVLLLCCCCGSVALPGTLKNAQVSFAGSCVAIASRRNSVVCVYVQKVQSACPENY